MDKIGRSELKRKFLIDGLPPPLMPSSRHIQISDNYLAGTHLRLRKIREPYENTWTFIVQKRQFSASSVIVAEIYLDDREYGHFQQFEGREIRKNRYFHEFDMAAFAIDVYLGPLKGLLIAQSEFDAPDKMDQFIPPPFCKVEITNDESYLGEQLVDRSFSELYRQQEQ